MEHGNGAGVNDSSWDTLSFTTISYDTHGGISSGLDRYTVPLPGIYRVAANVRWVNFGGVADCDIAAAIYLNGAEIIRDARFSYRANSENYSNNPDGDYEFAAGDVLDLRVFQNSGGIQATVSHSFMIHRIGGREYV
jgi:hypothetical protein